MLLLTQTTTVSDADLEAAAAAAAATGNGSSSDSSSSTGAVSSAALAALFPGASNVTVTGRSVTFPIGLVQLAVLPVSISTGGSGGGTIDVNGGTSTTTPGGANGGTSTPTTGGANDLCPGELAALARSIRSELAARLGLNDSQVGARPCGA